MYKLVKEEADFDWGTSLQGNMDTSYAQIVKVLGEPNSEGDGHKVSHEWLIVGPKGESITIYDYKDTTLYSSECVEPWELERLEFVDWHIGAKSSEDAKAFIEWFYEEAKKNPVNFKEVVVHLNSVRVRVPEDDLNGKDADNEVALATKIKTHDMSTKEFVDSYEVEDD